VAGGQVGDDCGEVGGQEEDVKMSKEAVVRSSPDGEG